MSSGHTVTAFDTELDRLNRIITEMGGLAEEQLANAVQALSSRDGVLAAQVMERDAEIDRREQEVEALVVRLLALRQPMAQDLREVIAALKIGNNIERIGDFARNIAKRSLALNQMPPSGPITSVARMAQSAREMVHDVIAAFATRNAELALDVRRRDADVDAIYTSLFRELLTYMMETPQQITACTHLMFVAKNIERIGDHATNIAETICFQVKGATPEQERRKDDFSSYAVVKPSQDDPPASRS